MALIPIYHAIADYYNLAVSNTISADNNNNILAGQIMVLTSAGASRATSATGPYIGIAGDSTIAPTVNNLATATGAGLIMGGVAGGTVTDPTFTGYSAWTQNRVSDPAYNETRASNKITVYHGGGKFWTDQYAAYQSWTVGAAVYCTTGGLFTTTGTTAVGVCFAAPSVYPSGVPGTDTLDGSMALGTFLGVILTIV